MGSTRTARSAGSRPPARIMTMQRPVAIPKFSHQFCTGEDSFNGAPGSVG